jgi:hypothetical protein
VRPVPRALRVRSHLPGKADFPSRRVFVRSQGTGATGHVREEQDTVSTTPLVRLRKLHFFNTPTGLVLGQNREHHRIRRARIQRHNCCLLPWKAPAKFKVVFNTYLTATVPSGATTGCVTETTPHGKLTSDTQFRVTSWISSSHGFFCRSAVLLQALGSFIVRDKRLRIFPAQRH